MVPPTDPALGRSPLGSTTGSEWALTMVRLGWGSRLWKKGGGDSLFPPVPPLPSFFPRTGQ